MLAGSDTTAIYLRAVFYFLLKDPKSMKKLEDEIISFKSATGFSEVVSWKESKQLPYLEACIKEAGRLHPPIGLPLERIVPTSPEGGIDLNGHFIPQGTVIGINAWVVQRDKQIFGDDADLWRPERWLVDDEEKINKMNRAMFVVRRYHQFMSRVLLYEPY